MAAFAGPESAEGMRDAIGDDGDLKYVGSFVMTGVFNLANALFTCLIFFPSVQPPVPPTQKAKSASDVAKTEELPTLFSLLKTCHFVIPMLVSAIAWASMALPMSIVRVVMKEAGFSSRQSLTTIELHFAGMYSPGFVTGTLITLFGPKRIALAGIGVFGMALAFNFSANEKGDNGSNSRMAIWVFGLFFVGVAWNFCFTAATVWTTALYKQVPPLKPKVQAANDFLMFLLSGAWIVSASYIYEAGGSGMEGWDVLNWVVVGLVGLMGIIIAMDSILAGFEGVKESTSRSVDEENDNNDHVLDYRDTEAREIDEPEDGA